MITIIKPELAFFQVQIEGPTTYTRFCEGPKILNSVDVGFPLTEMFLVPKIDKSIVAAPTIAVCDAPGIDSATDNSLYSSFLAIGYDLCIDSAVALEDAEDYGLPQSSSTTFAFDPTSSEEAFIDVNLPPRKEIGLRSTGQYENGFL